MESIYKQIFFSRTIDIEASLNVFISKGPMEIMLSKIKDKGIVVEWKQKVKENMIEKEHHEQIGTGFMY